MKNLLIIISLVALCGCKGEAIETTQTNNAEYKLELLFENEGCKVYRFSDGGTRYYTDCSGSVSWKERHGKHTIDKEVQTENK